MYWGRSSALRPLLDLHLQIEEFQEEAGQIEGTLAHVIERSINLIAHKSGYAAVKIAPESFILPNVRFRKLRNAQQLERLIATTETQQLQQANLQTAGRSSPKS
jgi:lipopolysaccharide biosynthesis protein